MKQSRLPGALGVLLVVAGFFNVAQAATWGTQVNISTISPCPSFCGGSGGTSEFSVDGGEFVLSSFDTLNNADGDGQGIASLTGSSLLPILGAEGFSGSNSRIGTSAVGMLSYTYTGGTPTTISLDINLDGERGGTTDPGDAFVNSDVAVILGSVDDFITDYPTFIFEVVPGTPGLSVLGESNLSLGLNAGQTTLTDSISFTLNPGDEIFVWAGIEAGGTRGGFGDAFNTLSMSFSDDTGIAPSDISAVPVPAAVWLFGSGLLGLVGVARRKAA